MTETEKKAFHAAFDEVILAAVPGMLDTLKEGRRKQAKQALNEFIREMDEEMKILRAIK
jgi:protein required for attachment to host cells